MCDSSGTNLSHEVLREDPITQAHCQVNDLAFSSNPDSTTQHAKDILVPVEDKMSQVVEELISFDSDLRVLREGEWGLKFVSPRVDS